ncbi:MAG: adenylate kinase [Bacteroidetes bacterium]|nr:adenylate kinase [Bacteroidota bacterium]
MNLILFGPPGSGKGTQAVNLKERYNLLHISTGDLFRNELASETPLGLEAKGYMDKGVLVPDSIVIGMIEKKLDEENNVDGVIYDGFPRTIDQATALDEMLRNKNTGIDLVLALEVSEEELTRRILKRGESSGRADDQDESIIKERVREYEEKTATLAKYYEEQNKFVSLKGEGSVEDISESLYNEVDKVAV